MTRGLRFPPFAKPGALAPKPAAADEQLPPIEDYLDELPSIDDFLDHEDYPPIEEFAPSEESDEFFEPVAAAEPEEGWAAGSWQSYDWSSAAALNRSTSSAVDSSDAWSESEWPDPVRVPHDSFDSGPSADEIADALDGIAHRIRNGELVIDKLQGTQPEVAMAAALAVLLRMRG